MLLASQDVQIGPKTILVRGSWFADFFSKGEGKNIIFCLKNNKKHTIFLKESPARGGGKSPLRTPMITNNFEKYNDRLATSQNFSLC